VAKILLILSVLVINVIVHVRMNLQIRLAFQKIEKNVIDNMVTEEANSKQVRGYMCF